MDARTADADAQAVLLTTLVSLSLKNLMLVKCMWQGALRVPPEVTAMELIVQTYNALDGSQCRHTIVFRESGYGLIQWCGDRVPEIICMPTHY